MSRTRPAGLVVSVLAVLAGVGLLILRATVEPESYTVSTVLQAVAVGVLVPSVAVCAIALFRRALRTRGLALRPKPELVLDVVRTASIAALAEDRGSAGRIPVFLELVVTVGGLEVWGGARFRRVFQLPWNELRSIGLANAADGGQAYQSLQFTMVDGSATTAIVTGGGLTGLGAIEGARLHALVNDLDRIRHDRMLRRPKTRYPNVVQATVDGFCTNAGMVKRSGSWYQLTDEVGTVVNLQKSDYSGQGFLNVAIWLEPSGTGPFPKENECPIRTRLELLVPPDIELPSLLNADCGRPREEHAASLMAVLEQFLVPILNATASLQRLRTSDVGRKLLARSLVKPAARRLLAATEE